MSDNTISDEDKNALIRSQAGMRFIAQMTLYNNKNLGRLKIFIEESYHEQALIVQPADFRLQEFKAIHKLNGRLKVKKVLAVSKHHVILALQTEKNEHLYYAELEVEEDYPHRIMRFMFTRLQEAQNPNESQEVSS